MEKDDMVLLDYDLLTTDGEWIETTNEEKAKKHDIHDENVLYEPVITVVGSEGIIKGMDDALLDSEPGKEYEIEIGFEDAYGKRDLKKIELYKIHRIRKLVNLCITSISITSTFTYTYF